MLELQHSSISEEERASREAFYRQERRMFWLVHIHSESSFLAHNFGMSMDFRTRRVELDGKTFAVMHWMGRSVQFIEKWKRARAHVFFDWGGHILYLAGETAAQRLGGPFQRGEFALCELFRAMTSSVLSTGPTDLRRQRPSSGASMACRVCRGVRHTGWRRRH